MEAQSEAKAKAFAAQAEARLKTSGFKALLEGKNEKFIDAAELYKKAADFYKLAKKMPEAGDSYAKAADCCEKTGNKYEAASHFSEASFCYRKISTDTSSQFMKQAVTLYLDEGKFSMAAKCYKDLGELYEQDNNLEEAMDANDKAADLMENDKSPANANTLRLKNAHFAATLEKYQKAFEIFEKAAEVASTNKLTEFSAVDHLFKAALCRLAAGDTVGTKKALEKYGTILFKWNGSRESKFVQELLEAVEGYDRDAFRDAVQAFDSISRLDQFKTRLLNKIREDIKEEGEEGII